MFSFFYVTGLSKNIEILTVIDWFVMIEIFAKQGKVLISFYIKCILNNTRHLNCLF